MFSILIGIGLASGFFGLLNHSKSKNLNVSWWQWTLTIIWLAYTGFVLKMIEGFIDESAMKAALVLGGIFGFVSIIGAVLLSRFVFLKSTNHE
ncbi:MAG: hypothetical protein KAH17_03270 [Bacteroidales bacterium]|nr:hypothetical protein [Bacteroidales bacterium]